MHIVAILILLFVFGFIFSAAMLLTVGYLTHKQYPNLCPRVIRFLGFLLLPHLYLHQMYNYAAKIDQGYKTNVQYVINGVSYEANGLNYYEAMWKAAEKPVRIN